MAAKVPTRVVKAGMGARAVEAVTMGEMAEAGRVGVVMGAMEGGVGAIGGVVARQSVRTV